MTRLKVDVKPTAGRVDPLDVADEVEIDAWVEAELADESAAIRRAFARLAKAAFRPPRGR